jgi:hypothetical protein
LLEDGGASLQALAVLVRLQLHLRLHHHGVLQKVQPTLLALAAVLLHMLAAGANVTNRGMTSKAELRCLRILVPALWTFHGC